MTGRTPYEEIEDRGLLLAISGGKLPADVSELDSPPFVKHLLNRCWSTQPQGRTTMARCASTFADCNPLARHIREDFPNWNQQHPEPGSQNADWSFTSNVNTQSSLEITVVQQFRFLGPRCAVCLSFPYRLG